MLPGVLYRLEEHRGDGLGPLEFDRLGDPVGRPLPEGFGVGVKRLGCAVEVGVGHPGDPPDHGLYNGPGWPRGQCGSHLPRLGHDCLPRLHDQRRPRSGRKGLYAPAVSVVSVSARHDPSAADDAHPESVVDPGDPLKTIRIIVGALLSGAAVGRRRGRWLRSGRARPGRRLHPCTGWLLMPRYAVAASLNSNKLGHECLPQVPRGSRPKRTVAGSRRVGSSFARLPVAMKSRSERYVLSKKTLASRNEERLDFG
jgi:hypothetical protein